MSKRNRSIMSHVYPIILYLCGLILFLEWLYPIEQVTDTNSILIFVLYTLFCFIISLLELKWWVSFLLKGFGMLFILNGLYFNMTFLSVDWMNVFFTEIKTNSDILISQNWYYLSSFFRSFLFLLLIWLMSYLLHYWFVQMKRIFLFIVLTFVYITVLDTFTDYDAVLSIVRTFVVSLAALALTNLNRELEKEKISFKRTSIKAWLVIPLVFTILFSGLIGLIGPKVGPHWPDPVPFIDGVAEQTGGSGGSMIQKVGYGEDDSELGGSFIQDDTPVFQVESSMEQYWRIETKDVYTGKGWENSEDQIYVEREGRELVLGSFSGDVETEERSARFEFLDGQNFDKLVYPYGMKGVTDASHEVDYFIEQLGESVETRMNGKGFEIDYYEVMYDHPSFSLNTLQENRQVTEDMSSYLQLPDSLPERVADLAEDITAEHGTQYEKVRAVERYFGRNDFSYETTGVAVPGEDEDYVDQFLFDTQIGYCDNFSSAMVVMLRTLDIPARWVKGFTGGEVVEEREDLDQALYEVTNSNAHAWVEVYFPDVGWVAFEPTQGFSNLTDFHLDQTEASQETGDDVLYVQEREQEETESGSEEEEASEAMAEPSYNHTDDSSQGWMMITAGVAVLVFAIFLLYKFRFQLQSIFYSIKLGSRKDEQGFQDAYHHVLAVLNHEGYGRKENQTLREYAKRVDAHYQTEAMQELTTHYERMLYRKAFDPADVDYLKMLWKQLLQTIRG